MTQGDELREKLENVLAIIRESENNFMQRTSLESQIREQAQEKVELSFGGKKGKAKLMGIAIGCYILVYLLLATIVQQMLGTWIVIAIAAVITFVSLNKHPVIAGIAGIITVLMMGYMIFYCVIIPTVNAFATGNIPGIVITLAMAAILILMIYLINHKMVRDKNNKIREANYEIMVNNANVVNQLKVLYSRAMELDKALRSQLTPGGFYPQAYAYEQAAESFVRYIKNMEYGTPVTMQFLIEKYENDVHKQQEVQHWRTVESKLQRMEDLITYYGDNILQNQEEMQRSLRLQNIISLNMASQLTEQNERLSEISSKLNNNVRHVKLDGTLQIRR